MLKAKDIKELLKLVRDNKGFQDDVGYYSFILSLLPIPGLQQAGQVLNKLSSDHKLKLEFDELRTLIEENNDRLNEVEDEVSRIKELAVTLETNGVLYQSLNDKIVNLLSELEEDKTEFEVETKGWSTQVLVKQLIEADLVSITAVDNSINVIQDTKIRAKKTKLTAENGSINYIDGTKLSGDRGHVNINGIKQGGNVTIEGSSVNLNQGGVDLGGGSGIFGLGSISGNGSIGLSRSVQCPNLSCRKPLEVGNAALIQCSYCGQRIKVL
jgi:hypothetical protein